MDAAASIDRYCGEVLGLQSRAESASCPSPVNAACILRDATTRTSGASSLLPDGLPLAQPRPSRARAPEGTHVWLRPGNRKALRGYSHEYRCLGSTALIAGPGMRTG